MDKPNNFEEIFSTESLEWWFSNDPLEFIRSNVFSFKAPLTTINGWFTVFIQSTNVSSINLPENLKNPENGIEKMQDVLDLLKKNIDEVVNLTILEQGYTQNQGGDPFLTKQHLAELFDSEQVERWLAKAPLDFIQEIAAVMEAHTSTLERWISLLIQVNIEEIVWYGWVAGSTQIEGNERTQKLFEWLETSANHLKNYVYLSYTYVNHKRGEDNHGRTDQL